MSGATRVLLVDDDASVLELTGELLAMVGFDVIPERSGRAALERLLAGETFGALVTDHSMPEMTGEELILRVHRLAPELPCLLVTGHGENVELSPGVALLRKPFRASQLAAVLERLLAQPRPDRQR